MESYGGRPVILGARQLPPELGPPKNSGPRMACVVFSAIGRFAGLDFYRRFSTLELACSRGPDISLVGGFKHQHLCP